MWSFIQHQDNRDFFRFWLSQLISQFGDRVHQMALVGLIAVRAPGSTFELAKLLSFTIIPVFIIGPIAGVFVDRWDRRTTMFVCDLIRGALVLAIAFYFMHLPDLWPLYTAVFLIFTFSRFHVIAKMSFIPQLVRPNDLHIANSLVTTTGMIALVLGALLGGYIVEYVGAKGGFIWDATTFFISGLLVISISSVRRWRINREGIMRNTKEMVRAQKTVWTEIIEGVRYISRQRQIRFIFIMMSVLFAAAGAVYVVIIVFVQQAFNSVTKDLGFLAVPLGIGLFVGSLAFGKWGGRVSKFKTMFLSLVLGGLLIALFAALVEGTHNRNLAVALVFILGLVSGPVVIASNTILHQVCDSQMSGKVFAALEFVMHLAFLGAMLATSLIAESIPRAWILIAVGVIFTIIGFIGLFKSRHWKGIT